MKIRRVVTVRRGHQLLDCILQCTGYFYVGLQVQFKFSKYWRGLGVSVMEFSATFNNISDISWRSVLLTEETGVPRENDRSIE